MKQRQFLDDESPRRRARRERPQGPEVQGPVRRPDAGRHGHPAREHLHGRRRPRRRPHDRALPLRRGVQQVDQGHRRQHGYRPDAGALLCGRRRRLHHGVNMGRFIDPDTTPETYMYHRQLFRLPATRPRRQVGPHRHRGHRRRRGRQRRDLPRHRVARQGPPAARRRIQEPAVLHELHGPDREPGGPRRARRANPNLMSVVNMPEKTSGYQRKSQAIMYGTGAIGAAPPATIGNPVLDTTGEITAAQPVARIPFTATAGRSSSRSWTRSRPARPTSS